MLGGPICWRSWRTSLKFKQIEDSQHFETLGASKPREAPIFSRFKTQKDRGLSACWDSGSSKTLRGFNLVEVRTPKKIEASQYFGRLGAPKPGEASIFLGFNCKNAGRPQKTQTTIFWKSWKTSLKLKEIEASQHFETLGPSKPRETPIFSRFKTQKD